MTGNPYFPRTMADSVVAEALVSYSGQFWEDSNGEYVENVAALMISNPTEQTLAFGAFAVEQAGGTMYFFVHRLPPQSRCLILEYEKKACLPEKVTDCRALRLQWEHPDYSPEQVDYFCRGRDMTIINRDDRPLSQVTVWYKRYDREAGYYIGGIAYAAYLHTMLPGERRTLQPAHYDAACARIVGIALEV